MTISDGCRLTLKQAGDILRTGPAASGVAPGHVFLLGEPADPSGGLALSLPIALKTTVLLAPSFDDAHHFYCAELERHEVVGRRGHIGAGFARHMLGCIRILEESGVVVPALRAFVRSDLINCTGAEWPTTLEVATLRALRDFLHLEFDDMALALYAQRASGRYAGVERSLMEAIASAFCTGSSMLQLDTGALAARALPVPAGAQALVIDNVVESLPLCLLEERRRACAAGRHLVSEQARVRRAAQCAEPSVLGKLMNESHASLRDDLSAVEGNADRLVRLLQQHPDVFGARVAGGRCVALCREGESAAKVKQFAERFKGARL